MSALSRAEGAASRVCQLRLLSRPPGARRRQRLATGDRQIHYPMIWIAVDAMGGDFAPRHIVDGALAAARHFDLGVALVGPRAVLEGELGRHADVDPARVHLLESTDVIAMEESPAAALRRKPGASIRVAADAVKR